MDFCFNIFGKKIEELTLNDIEKYFKTPKEESDLIEYKSFYQKNQENFRHKESSIFKTICAFLNSQGGLLIWGGPIEDKIDGKKVYKDELSPVSENIEKDDFFNKVVNRITPIPEKVDFLKVNHENGYIYVIQVQRSDYRPHQFDSRFWMRSNGQTNKAPYHYVEALFKRITYPKLKGKIYFSPPRFQGDRNYRNRYKIYFNVCIENLSNFLNETNPKYILMVNNIVIKRDETNNILHFGDPIKKSANTELEGFERKETEVVLRFGGDKSPLRESKYCITTEIVNETRVDGKSAYSEKQLKYSVDTEYEDKFIFEID